MCLRLVAAALLPVAVAIAFAAEAAAQQTCPDSSILILGQDEVDRFPERFPGCTTIRGNLIVRGAGDSTAIVDLSPLAGLEEVTQSLLLDPDPADGNLDIRRLASLRGLGSLRRVGKDLKIRGADSLRNLAGLDSLREVGGDVELTSNDSLLSLRGLGALQRVGGKLFLGFSPLTDLAGLAALVSIGGDLDFQALPGLESLTGLSNLRVVGGTVKIVAHARLSSLAGLEGLRRVGGRFRLAECGAVADLDPLASLAEVGGGLSLVNLSSLADVTGLGGLGAIGGALTVRGADALTSLVGLEGVAAGSITRLALEDNARLEVCALHNVCTFLAEAPLDSVAVVGNAGSCASVDSLAARCRIVLPTRGSATRAAPRLSPNPTAGPVSVVGGDVVQAVVYDLTGREVVRPSVRAGRFDLGGLPGGSYVVVLRTADRRPPTVHHIARVEPR